MLLAALALSSIPAPTPPEPAPPLLRALVVSGANNHDWQWTSRELHDLLEASGKFEVTVTSDPASHLAGEGGASGWDVFVLDYNGPRWGEAAEAAFLGAVRGGTGVAVIHAANNAFPGWVEYEKLVGDLWREGTGHGRFHPFDVTITDRDHPITRDMADLVAHPDELYHNLVRMHGTEHRVLATARSSSESGGTGEDEPMILVGSYGEGRVFHTPLGHVWRDQPATRPSFRDAAFRDLVVRGTEWAATGDVTVQRCAPNTLTDAERADGWRLLFDGSDTGAWRGFRRPGFPEAGWSARDGALVVEAGGGGGDIVTVEEFGDFELDLEWRVTEKANSGIMVRVDEAADATYWSGPEIQVLDDALFDGPPNELSMAGSLYAIMPATNRVVRRPGSWNRSRIRVRGSEISHWLNGGHVLTCDLESEDGRARIAASKFGDKPMFARAARGRIALQDHGDEVWYRNIKVRPLPSESEWVELFNGRDLEGWTHYLEGGGDPKEIWSVENGVLICAGTQPGYLRTIADYVHFELELDWRFDPVTRQAGNSGVLFRMIGEDKVWPKSIEAQLHSGNAGDFWRIGDFPMKTAEDRTNGRNTKKLLDAENPVGEWNHYRIVVNEGLVALEVNGRIVNEGSEALVTPGKICLQSEGVEIHFKDVRLRSLEP